MTNPLEARLAALEARVALLEGTGTKTPKTKKKPTAAISGANGHSTGITEGNGSAKVPTTPQSKRIADIFHRRHSTPWSEKEIKSYKKLGTIPEETLSLVEDYYKSGAMFLRRDLYTFLNNFSGEVDRATAWLNESKHHARNGSPFHA